MRRLLHTLALLNDEVLSYANNQVPIARITSSNGGFAAQAGQTLTFSGATSSDPDGGGITYYWWYVDGFLKHSGSSASSFSWSQSSAPGGATKYTYTLKLQVRDNENTTNSKTITIQVLAEERNYFVTDHLGNVRATVDQSGAVIGYDDYYPYGQVMSGRSSNTANANDIYKFTGHERDAELGLDYMLARNYDPEIGRFLSVDPLYDKYPGLSPYMYVAGNPIKFVDPDGREIVVGTLAQRIASFFGYKTESLQKLENVVSIFRTTETGSQMYEKLHARPELIYITSDDLKSRNIVGITNTKFKGEFTVTIDIDGANLKNNKNFNLNGDKGAATTVGHELGHVESLIQDQSQKNIENENKHGVGNNAEKRQNQVAKELGGSKASSGGMTRVIDREKDYADKKNE